MRARGQRAKGQLWGPGTDNPNTHCKLRFDDRIGNVWKKAGAKLNALTRVAQYMNAEKSA